MPEELTVLPVRAEDLDQITRLEVVCFPGPWPRQFFEAELSERLRYCRVAKRDGEIAGYLFAMYFLDELHINKIATDPKLRRAGVATGLMNDCVTFAVANSIELLWLEVRETNQAAISFYEHLGFTIVHSRSNYYPDGEAALVMSRKL